MPRKTGLDRGAIVREAALLADESGIGNVTFAQLAERVGIRAPSLYNHVESVDVLHRELAALGLRALATAMARAAVGRNGPEGIVAIAAAYRAFAKERPGLYAATLPAADPSDPDMRCSAAEMMETTRAVLAPFALDEPATIHALRALRSLVHGFVSLEAAGAFGLPENVDESFAWALEAFVRSLPDPQPTARLKTTR
jgi:AcrR family transcriptional regulator